eukprot:CAMPEP_0173431934 /NCGR_PEP_ID=MMETSP1357-20121228/9910_1 /TAXON_ID=77926 /ORGANISM="Hemiselmis rufescens, Strain PCC563" /LENGTH=104 /DNA_ID=CAMNT_0014396467 /DNA_START=137 /DNA_END=448 /DNA_ORIENTATION=-
MTRAHRAVAASLALSCESLAMFWVDQESVLGEGDRQQVLSAMRCMGETLVPYIAACMQRVYGTSKPEMQCRTVAACVLEQVEFEEKAIRERQGEEERRKREEEE